MKSGPFAVNIDKNKLTEYNRYSDLEEKAKVCWVPSEPGKKFEVHYRNLEPKSRGCYFLELCLDDGYKEGSAYGRSWDKVEFKGRRVSEEEVRCFKFARIQLVDDDNVDDATTTKSDRFGEVKLIIYKATEKKINWCNCCNFSDVEQDAEIKMAEKTSKGRTHGIAYGNKVKSPRTEKCTNDGPHYAYELGSVLAQFIFKYCPVDVINAKRRPQTPRETRQESTRRSTRNKDKGQSTRSPTHDNDEGRSPRSPTTHGDEPQPPPSPNNHEQSSTTTTRNDNSNEQPSPSSSSEQQNRKKRKISELEVKPEPLEEVEPERTVNLDVDIVEVKPEPTDMGSDVVEVKPEPEDDDARALAIRLNYLEAVLKEAQQELEKVSAKRKKVDIKQEEVKPEPLTIDISGDQEVIDLT